MLNFVKLQPEHMTDLINNNLRDKVLSMPLDNYTIIQNKFIPILETFTTKVFRDELHLKTFVYTLNFSYEWIRTNHNELDKDLCTWIMVVIKDLFFANKINTEEDIINLINDIIPYWNNGHKQFIETMDIWSGEYYRDRRFISAYLNKKIDS
jgi:hypothetical protein